MSGDSDPPNNNGQDKQQEDVEMSTNESPALAPPSEQPKNSLDLQLVTGYRSGPAPKRTLPSSPRWDPLPTSNRFHILEEDDVELSFEDFAVPRIVLEDSSAPRPKKTKGKAKKQRLNKSGAAHLELAKKIIRDKKVEGSITECQRILRDDPQLVAHAMYAQDEDLSLFQSLVATKTIERKMALLKAQVKPHNYKHHVNFMAQYKIHPSEILEELTTDIPEIKRILFALATIDLFLSNRAPDLYTNSEALTVLLNQEATIMVRVLYSGRKSRILVNGFLSKPVHISRGVLQGDPLSPLLFVIALEPMCQLLRQHSNYGIKCGDRYHTGSYFADDSQLYAANETCLHRQLALVQTFCDKSDKTQILTYSQLNGNLASLQVTSDSPVKALGILVAPNLSPLARFNYVFEKFVARLSLWLYKARTMAGKVTILHSICLPVLWYQLAFVPADKDLAKKIDKAMLQFMHGEEINPSSSVHGLRLIKKEIIFMPKKSGG
ncbi:hypothetical protein AC1031_003290 [Aphanomyces cochlioides]|nr:hypothetical protein AC1031_003290 [Aphanomyces cochlioides]